MQKAKHQPISFIFKAHLLKVGTGSQLQVDKQLRSLKSRATRGHFVIHTTESSFVAAVKLQKINELSPGYNQPKNYSQFWEHLFRHALSSLQRSCSSACVVMTRSHVIDEKTSKFYFIFHFAKFYLGAAAILTTPTKLIELVTVKVQEVTKWNSRKTKQNSIL